MPIPLAGRPHYLSFLKPLMAIRSDRLVIYLRHYTFLYGHTNHNREDGKKRTNKQNRAWASSKRKREVCDTFVQLSVPLYAIAGVYLRETSTKPLGMLTYFLALISPASVGQQVLAVVFLISVLLSSLLCFHLPD